MEFGKKQAVVLGMILLLLVTLSCAAGNERFEVKPAGFWAGLWHGFICVFTFIISLFTDSVRMYEVSNTGSWYDFGFLLGAALFLGGSWGPHYKKKQARRMKDKEWDEIGDEVEEKIKKGIQNWLDESGKKEKEWQEIAKKIEEKIKRELRNWAEK